jgi:hypothetical protein
MTFWRKSGSVSGAWMISSDVQTVNYSMSAAINGIPQSPPEMIGTDKGNINHDV